MPGLRAVQLTREDEEAVPRRPRASRPRRPRPDPVRDAAIASVRDVGGRPRPAPRATRACAARCSSAPVGRPRSRGSRPDRATSPARPCRCSRRAWAACPTATSCAPWWRCSVRTASRRPSSTARRCSAAASVLGYGERVGPGGRRVNRVPTVEQVRQESSPRPTARLAGARVACRRHPPADGGGGRDPARDGRPAGPARPEAAPDGAARSRRPAAVAELSASADRLKA